VASRNLRDTSKSHFKAAAAGGSCKVRRRGHHISSEPRAERGEGRRRSCWAGSLPGRTTSPHQNISREKHCDCPGQHGTSEFVAYHKLRHTATSHFNAAAAGRSCIGCTTLPPRGEGKRRGSDGAAGLDRILQAEHVARASRHFCMCVSSRTAALGTNCKVHRGVPARLNNGPAHALDKRLHQCYASTNEELTGNVVT
jgi:hypothetical protein